MAQRVRLLSLITLTLLSHPAAAQDVIIDQTLRNDVQQMERDWELKQRPYIHDKPTGDSCVVEELYMLGISGMTKKEAQEILTKYPNSRDVCNARADCRVRNTWKLFGDKSHCLDLPWAPRR